MAKHDKEAMKLKAVHYLKVNGITWTEYNNGYQFRIGRVDFFPTTGNWMDSDRGMKGEGVEQLVTYLKTRKTLSAAHVCPHCNGALTITMTKAGV